jgi:hypothetical protein
MKKRISLSFIITLCILVLLSACSGTSEKAPSDEPEATPKVEEAVISNINIFQTGAASLETQTVGDVNAYSIADYLTATFETAPTGHVVLVATDGYAATSTMEELSKYYITLEGNDAPLIVGDSELPGELKVKYLQYIKTGSEIIYFASGEEKAADIFKTVEMTEADSYVFTATDGFNRSVPADQLDTVTLSYEEGTVNVTLPELPEPMRDLVNIKAE